MDEGYIKFTCNWEKKPIKLRDSDLFKINTYRSKLIQQNMIGKISNGPGFGNISIKTADGFVITGSNTGHKNSLSISDCALVNYVDINKNRVACIGQTIASSESMTHAVIYKNTMAHAVIHIHHKNLWKLLLNKLPTTKTEVPYGTPEMAIEIKQLIKNYTSRLFILGGHEEGIIAYGNSLSEAYAEIMNHV